MDRRSRWLAILALVVMLCGAFPSLASADHFRGGYITWKRPTGIGTTVEFESIQVWRSGAVTPLAINPGVGDVTLLGPVSTIFTGVDLAGDPYTVISYKATYTYASPGSYTAFLGIGTQSTTCCRIDDLVNSSDDPQRVTTVVDVGPSSSNTGSPKPAIPMLLPVSQNCATSIPLPITDADGYTCALATPAQSGSSGMFPITAPTAPNDVLSVSAGCVLSWYPTGTTIGDKYAAQIIITDAAADNTQIAVDLIIEVRAGNCPVCGDNLKQGLEECDGTDDALCPGTCQSNCSCCGDGLIQPGAGEYCDGANDAACPGNCQGNCTCCGDGITEPAANEVCDGADDAACFPTPGLGCGGNCHCAVPGGGGGGCTDVCADDVSVCSGHCSLNSSILCKDDNDCAIASAGFCTANVYVVDVGQPFSIPFLGSDPCDALIVNDATWGLLPPGSSLTPPSGTLDPAPTTGTCSHDNTLTCSTCHDCDHCTHDTHVTCDTDTDCSSLSPGSTCASGATCTKPANEFPATFNWTPTVADDAQTWGVSVTFTPPGFTIPGGTQYFCDFQIRVPGCGDDIVDKRCSLNSSIICTDNADCAPSSGVCTGGEQCDGAEAAACGGDPCLPPGDPHECRCPVCGDDDVNTLDEDCDGTDSGQCPGACRPPGDPNECTCPVCGDNFKDPGEQCDGSDDAVCDGKCLPNCQCAVCGDGIIHVGLGERCEVGGNDAACPGNCLPPGDPNECKCRGCGDGDVNQPSEQCDGADAPTCPGLCLANCLCPVCGDGAINAPGEQCDGAASAACPGQCRPPGDPNQCKCPVCGDGDVNQGSEQCDGTDAPTCPGLCLPSCLCPVCGDGAINAPGEQCDGASDAACLGACLPPGNPNQCKCPVCGDGDINQGSEQCDGGDDAACPGRCLPSCQCPVCGDGVVSAPGENCEATSDTLCPGLCRPPGDPNQCRCPVCGDGDLNQPSEQCDGADAAACPGLCAVDCTCSVCGDGTLSPPVEDCDGALDAACPGECFPPGGPNACRCPRCGDGIVNQPSEECDGAATGTCVTGVCQPDCTYASCGNCALDPGEQCDPPNREICDNAIDDDGDGRLNCADTDCTPGRTCKHPDPTINALVSTWPCASAADCNGRCSHDTNVLCTNDATCSALSTGSVCVSAAKCACNDTSGAPFQTCGDACAPVFGCGCINNDPARIRFGTKPGDPGLFKMHGRFEIESPMDPPADGFTILLSNADGIVYMATLHAGDLVGGKGRFKFADPTAKHGNGTRDGLYKVVVRMKLFHGVLNYMFHLQAYGDFSAASAKMTTQVIAGDDTASLNGDWTATGKGWKLTDFE